MSESKLHEPGTDVDLDLTGVEKEVLHLLHESMGRHVTTDELAFGSSLIPATRTNSMVRQALRSLNMKGWPIAVSGRGAMLTGDVDELYRYRESLWRRAEKIIARAHALTNIIKRHEAVIEKLAKHIS